MNSEVMRLRRLRQSALKVRALAGVLSGTRQASSLFERGALLTWRIARVATGRLRSHPCQSYQSDPSFFESGADRLGAILLGTTASLRGQGEETFLTELRAAARALDDTRSLTLSPDLSDALGRAQASMRILLSDLQMELLHKSEMVSDPPAGGGPRLATPELSPSPYLAL